MKMVLLRRHNILRRLRNLSLRSVTLIMVMMVVISNEFLIYWIQSWRWPSLPTTSRDPRDELVVLFVSDPQLIGIQDEHGFPLGMITRWDSDRYLRKTFSLAYSYAQPDVVVFLGDLMDEGSKATRDEYQSYYDRFHDIFSPARRSKLDFRSQYDSLHEKKQVMMEITHKLTAPVRIIINHESVISQMKMLVYPLLKIAQPNLIFTGHWHESLHYVCETCLSSNEDSGHWPVHLRDTRKLVGWTEVDFTNLISVNELMVPTCSYRMGTKRMGYGAAIIRRSGSMQYTVLWLPHATHSSLPTSSLSSSCPSSSASSTSSSTSTRHTGLKSSGSEAWLA